jgi:hypothetical protein
VLSMSKHEGLSGVTLFGCSAAGLQGNQSRSRPVGRKYFRTKDAGVRASTFIKPNAFWRHREDSGFSSSPHSLGTALIERAVETMWSHEPCPAVISGSGWSRSSHPGSAESIADMEYDILRCPFPRLRTALREFASVLSESTASTDRWDGFVRRKPLRVRRLAETFRVEVTVFHRFWWMAGREEREDQVHREGSLGG